MAQTIKLKRSANSTLTSGQGIPTTSNLELGEVAINTYHGKMYIKKNDGSESIVEVGAADNTKLPLAGGTMTGALNMGGNNITSPSNFTLDVAGDITLDAAGGDFNYKINGTEIFRISNTALNTKFLQVQPDSDMIFKGNDDGSEITALRLDMSNAGTATFNHDIKLFDGGKAIFGTDQDLVIQHNDANAFIQNTKGDIRLQTASNIILDADGANILLKDDGTEFGRLSRVTSDFVIKSSTSDKDIIFKGVDGGTTITALTLDMSEGGNATFANNVTISGNLEVTGTTTQTGSIITNSNFTGLSDANSANATDFGFYGKYVESSTTKYAGMYYDASTDNTFKLFCDTQTAPTTTVNESATGYALANLNIAGLTTTGNVGIGIANTTAPLVVQAQTNAVGINLVGRTSDSIGELNFAASNGTNQSSIQSRTTDLRIKTLQSIPLTFHTVNTERMRLDTSGNLFVGTTSQISSGKISVAGGASANGITATTAATSGFAAASFQRTASDGQLIQFKKGSSEVGTIGTDGGDMYLGTGITGLIFNDANNAILPYRTNAEDDANIDIGLSSFRFRNLHLSGSANIGTNILMSNASTSGFMQVSTNILQFGTSSNDPLAIFTNNSEQIRIDTDGRLLLNTTSSIDNLSQLHIVGFTSGRAGITLQDGDSTTQKTFLTQSSGTTRFNTQNGTSYGSFQIGGWNGTTSADFVRVTEDG